MADAGDNHAELLQFTAEIVSAHAANNHVPPLDLAESIENVYTALAGLSVPSEEPKEPQEPAVPIKRSITDDYLVCLEDGRKLKMLKRHLKTAYDMTPEEYRAKWNLPYDYPMVAPNYAKKRQELAKKIGLGRKPQLARKKRGKK